MRNRQKRVRPFKENLKRMLLGYSLAPVFGLLAVCAIIILSVGCFVIASGNRRVNRQIAGSVETALDSYEALTGELSAMPDLVDPLMSSTKRQKIVRKLYTVSLETGYEAELYILDAGGTLCASVNTGADSEEYSRKDISRMSEPIDQSIDRTVIDVVTLGGAKRIYLVRAVTDGEAAVGYVVLGIPEREFSNLISSHIQTNLIADRTGWTFAASSYRFVDAVGRVEKKLREERGFCILSGQCYYISESELCGGELQLYTVTDNSEVVNLLLTVLLTSLGVLLFVVIASLSSSERMAKKSTVDIVKINDAFGAVMEGNLNAHLDIHSSTEFENIGKCYNQMLDSLNHQIAANRELAEAVADAQVRQLKSQFNSHFLFNTLDNIRFMCKMDPDLAENMTVSLSALLRYNTSRANEKVTVEEDLKYINLYFEIMKVRFRERFDFSVKVAENVKNKRIPKLLMQPLIENAIKYGFGEREHLTVQVSVLQREGKLVLSCRDDGVGIDGEQLAKIRQNLSLPENLSPHLGLYNVHRRIMLIYGEAYGMQVESELGVTVSLTLPLEEEGEEVAL